MGEKVCDSPPLISWRSYSDKALLETLQEITSVLHGRVSVQSICSLQQVLWELVWLLPVDLHLWSTSRDCKNPGLADLPAGGVQVLARERKGTVSTLATGTGIEDEKALEGSFL